MVDLDFYGHCFVGAVYLTLACWWNINIFKNYYLSKCKNGPVYTSRVWYPGPYFTNFPVELVFILASSTFLMVCFMARFTPGDHQYNSIIAHHELVLSTYMVYGIVSLLKYKQLPIPNGIESVTLVLLYLANAFLLYQHLHGKAPLNLHLHKILVFLYLASALTVFMEAQCRHQAILSLLRTWTIQVLGTWYVQISSILFSPYLSEEANSSKTYDMFVITSMIFIHCYGNALIIFGIGALSFYWMRKWSLTLISDSNWHANVLGKMQIPDTNASPDNLLTEEPDLST